MTLRSSALLCVFLAAGCSSGKVNIDSTSNDGRGDPPTGGGDGTTNGGDDGTTSEDTAGDGDEPGDFVGAWTRDAPLDLDGQPAGVVWTGNEDGSCRVELTMDNMVFDFSCTYVATADTFTMNDVECMDGEGSYTYVMSGDTLTLTLVEDPCETRREALASTWTRS